MTNTAKSVRESYDLVAAAYARHYANELQHKPLDRELLNRFAAANYWFWVEVLGAIIFVALAVLGPKLVLLAAIR